MRIKFQGAEYNLRFTYKSIYYLETAFPESYITTLQGLTDFNSTLFIFWAMIINEPNFNSLSIEETAELIQISLDTKEFTIDELFSKVADSYSDSTIVEQLFKNSPRGGGRRERASETRRERFYGSLRRLVYRFQRFLDKHS